MVQTGRRHYVTGEEWIICLLLSPVNFVGTFCDFGTRRTDSMIRACLCYGVMHVKCCFSWRNSIFVQYTNLDEVRVYILVIVSFTR